jgi:hypothetical protein
MGMSLLTGPDGAVYRQVAAIQLPEKRFDFRVGESAL